MSLPCTFSCDLNLQTFHSDYLKEANRSPIIVFFIGNFLISCSTSILRLQGKYGRFLAHPPTKMGHNRLRYQRSIAKKRDFDPVERNRKRSEAEWWIVRNVESLTSSKN